MYDVQCVACVDSFCISQHMQIGISIAYNVYSCLQVCVEKPDPEMTLLYFLRKECILLTSFQL